MNILNIQSSPLSSENSASRTLGSKVIEQLTNKYPNAKIVKKDLTETTFPYLHEKQIQAFFAPEESRTEQQQMEIAESEKAISELMNADILVVEAPMYNWNIPSVLKSYFDQIARAKMTFEYTGKGYLPQGLLKGKTAYIVTSSGGIYSEGELKPYDFTTNYTRFFLELLGIRVADVFRAEGQAIYGKEKAIETGIESVDMRLK